MQEREKANKKEEKEAGELLRDMMMIATTQTQALFDCVQTPNSLMYSLVLSNYFELQHSMKKMGRRRVHLRLPVYLFTYSPVCLLWCRLV